MWPGGRTGVRKPQNVISRITIHRPFSGHLPQVSRASTQFLVSPSRLSRSLHTRRSPPRNPMAARTTQRLRPIDSTQRRPYVSTPATRAASRAPPLQTDDDDSDPVSLSAQRIFCAPVALPHRASPGEGLLRQDRPTPLKRVSRGGHPPGVRRTASRRTGRAERAGVGGARAGCRRAPGQSAPVHAHLFHTQPVSISPPLRVPI